MNNLGTGFMAGVVVAIAGMSFSVQAIASNKYFQTGYCQSLQIQKWFTNIRR